MEDDEIIFESANTHIGFGTRGVAYDASYEWPDNNAEDAVLCERTRDAGLGKIPVCRFLVTRTSVLSPKHRIASIDGPTEVQFGRDALLGGNTPRIRLKEMEVSKLHATVYWDSTLRHWNVVDMGSKHGTFLQSSSRSTPSTSEIDIGTRLSPPRVASVPRRLRHLDSLTIGGTTFLIHIHDSPIACEQCTFIDGDEIPLHPANKSRKEPLLTNATTKIAAPQPYTRDYRSALTDLKRRLLPRHDDHSHSPESANSSTDVSRTYTDRSARRRALYPASGPDAPGTSLAQKASLSSLSHVGPVSNPEPTSIPEPVISQPPTPLPVTNIGHRMLSKQGWQPGHTLGILSDSDEGRVALLEPLTVKSSQGAGLGMGDSKTNGSGDMWNSKDTERRKRWDSVRLSRDPDRYG